MKSLFQISTDLYKLSKVFINLSSFLPGPFWPPSTSGQPSLSRLPDTRSTLPPTSQQLRALRKLYLSRLWAIWKFLLNDLSISIILFLGNGTTYPCSVILTPLGFHSFFSPYHLLIEPLMFDLGSNTIIWIKFSFVSKYALLPVCAAFIGGLTFFSTQGRNFKHSGLQFPRPPAALLTEYPSPWKTLSNHLPGLWSLHHKQPSCLLLLIAFRSISNMTFQIKIPTTWHGIMHSSTLCWEHPLGSVPPMGSHIP